MNRHIPLSVIDTRMRIPKRFGIRGLLALTTVFGTVFAWRYSDRNRILRARETVVDRGGRVLHTWQNPTVGITMLQPQSAPTPVIVNGKTEYQYPDRRPVPVQALFLDQPKPGPLFSITNTMLGHNDDIDIAIAVIPCDQVDNDLIDSLRTIKTLNGVMCVPVDNSYSRAMDMLKRELPNVEVSSARGSDLIAK